MLTWHRNIRNYISKYTTNITIGNIEKLKSQINVHYLWVKALL